jgi:hypothetical protein
MKGMKGKYMRLDKHELFHSLELLGNLTENVKSKTVGRLSDEVIDRALKGFYHIQDVVHTLVTKAPERDSVDAVVESLREYIRILKWDITDEELEHVTAFVDNVEAAPEGNGMNKLFLNEVRVFLDSRSMRDVADFFSTVIGKKETTLISTVDWLIASNRSTNKILN